MGARNIGVIFRKELLDTLRDRKTLFFMILLPILLIPGLMSVMARVTEREAEKTQTRRLVVQAQPDEAARLEAFLRARLAPLEAEVQQALLLLGPDVGDSVGAIARDLGLAPFDVLIRMRVDERVRSHPRFDELADRLLHAVGGAGRGDGDAPLEIDPAAREQALRLVDLLGPLVTIEFVDADEAGRREALRAAAPVESLPEAIRSDPRRAAAATAITERRIHALLTVPAGLDGEIVERDDSVAVEVLYDNTIELSQAAFRRIEASLAAAGAAAARERLAREGLPVSFLEPVAVAERDLASRSKEVMKLIASILPYLLILMSFLGAFYPAVDLGAGEKERFTLETLLVSPASRFEIAAGKFGVIFLASLVASVLSTSSMAWSFSSGLVSPRLAQMVELDIDAGSAALCLILFAPLAATFASLMLALSIYAKSQKEAQSLMMPLQFLIIVPAMLSMIPTLELDARFAWVPVMNVALGVRTILTSAGAALPWTEIAIILGSTALFAAATLAWCARRFGQEKVIFRS